LNFFFAMCTHELTADFVTAESQSLTEEAFKEVQSFKNKEYITLLECIEVFMLKQTKKDAIANICLIFRMCKTSEAKDPEGFQEHGLLVLEACFDRFKELPCCFECVNENDENASKND
jgi:hypothetical protein